MVVVVAFLLCRDRDRRQEVAVGEGDGRWLCLRAGGQWRDSIADIVRGHGRYFDAKLLNGDILGRGLPRSDDITRIIDRILLHYQVEVVDQTSRAGWTHCPRIGAWVPAVETPLPKRTSLGCWTVKQTYSPWILTRLPLCCRTWAFSWHDRSTGSGKIIR